MLISQSQIREIFDSTNPLALNIGSSTAQCTDGGVVRQQNMDDLDRISLEVAISILKAEAEAPGSQTPASVKLAQQILAYLQVPATDPIDPMSV